MIVEILREQNDYKLPINKYTWNALALQTYSDASTIEKFVHDCCNEFVDDNGSLLCMDDKNLWSNSLIRRMNSINSIREKRREAALARWSKCNEYAMHMQSNAIKEKKIKEIKEIKEKKTKKKEIKDIYITAQHLSMSKNEYDTLVSKYGQKAVDDKIEWARNYKKLKNYVSLYLTLNNWLKKDKGESEGGNIFLQEDV